MRALECSGPCPSKPCGRSSTRPERRGHLSSAEAMNWSMMTCAALREVAELRLPDDELVGAVEAVAVLEAEDARLAERRVVDLEAADAADAVAEVRERRVRLARLACRRGPRGGG